MDENFKSSSAITMFQKSRNNKLKQYQFYLDFSNWANSVSQREFVWKERLEEQWDNLAWKQKHCHNTYTK